jgi:hypothetical protein
MKMKFAQTRLPAPKLAERLKLVRGYIDLSREMHRLAFPGAKRKFGADMETMLVLMCVFIGDAEGHPMPASKIAQQIGLPRATVYRRLERLIRCKKIVRIGHVYLFPEDGVTPDSKGRLSSIVRQLCRP